MSGNDRSFFDLHSESIKSFLRFKEKMAVQCVARLQQSPLRSLTPLSLRLSASVFENVGQSVRTAFGVYA